MKKKYGAGSLVTVGTREREKKKKSHCGCDRDLYLGGVDIYMDEKKNNFLLTQENWGGAK